MKERKLMHEKSKEELAKEWIPDAKDAHQLGDVTIERNAFIIGYEACEQKLKEAEARADELENALKKIASKCPRLVSREEAADMAVEFESIADSALEQFGRKKG